MSRRRGTARGASATATTSRRRRSAAARAMSTAVAELMEPAAASDLDFEMMGISNDNSLFRMLQEVDPDITVPHLSQLESLSLELPSTFPGQAPERSAVAAAFVSAHSGAAASVSPEDDDANGTSDNPSPFAFAGRNSVRLGVQPATFLSAMDLASTAQPRSRATGLLMQPGLMAADASIASNTYPVCNTFGDDKRALPASMGGSGAGAGSGSLTSSSGRTSSLADEDDDDEDNLKRRRAALPKRQPKRSDFASEDAFAAAWGQWRAVREKNNAAVQRSREKAKVRKSQQRQALRMQERDHLLLQHEAALLRKNVTLLIKAVSHPGTLNEVETAWISTLTSSPGGALLAGQCSI